MPHDSQEMNMNVRFGPKLLGLTTVLVAVAACGESPTQPEASGPQFSRGSSDRGAKSHGKIVFASNGDIWAMNADGSGLENLTNDPAATDDTPSWSRNGQQIVFSSDRRNPGRVGGFPPAGQGGPNLEVYVMNADGSNPRRVTSTDQRDQWPQMSPDGKQIAFTRDLDFIHVPQNFVINVDGTGETNLTNNAVPACFPFGPPPCVFENYPRWSHNGKKILYNSATVPGDADIFVMNADGSEKTNLTNSPGSNDFFADWSPNGKKIAFSGGPPGEPDIFVMKINGSGLRQLTTDGALGVDLAPVWSPNGKKIAFFSIRGAAPDIFTINLDGTHETQLTTNPGPNGFLSWSAGNVGDGDDDDGEPQRRGHRRRGR